MRKRISKRRWKARYMIGRRIPMWAVVNFDLRFDNGTVAVLDQNADFLRRIA